ncbi:hypothetical protein ACHQM5_020580 [Ranunculus cassubicifolius]
MAGRLLQKRIGSALFRHQSNASFKEPLCDSSLFSPQRYQSPLLTIFNRAYQSQVNDVQQSDDQIENNTHDKSNNNNNLQAALSNLKTSSRHDMAIVFTCKVCETRSVKTACRSSYDKGVVVVRCGGCDNLHLIADRLGWFGEPGSVEELLAARGEGFKTGSADSLNLTLEDLAGVKTSA